MTRRRLLYLAPPALALIVVVAIQVQTMPSASLLPSDPAAPSLVDAPQDPLTDITPIGDPAPIAGVDTSDTDRRIAFWQARVAVTPRSETAWSFLGDLFDLKGRQTGDLTNFASARAAYQAALDAAPRSIAPQIGLARISLTLHDFATALTIGRAIFELDPSASAALAIIFDAAYELGDIDLAEEQLLALRDRSDSPAILIREARLAFLKGDAARAVSLSGEAADSADERGESEAGIAFYNYAAGELAFLAGDIDRAAMRYRMALDQLPGYALAVAGEGRVAYARGDLETAVARLESAVAAVPRPDLVAYLGDLYALTGRTADAEAQYETVAFIHGLASADGGRVYDREYATFLADHGRDAQTSVALARSELEQRRDVYGYDTLAWALHAAGRDSEAIEHMRVALALGTTDPKLLIHAGLIEISLGQDATGRSHIAQALALEPAFSPMVVEAARAAVAP